jgi:hypothetical protein
MYESADIVVSRYRIVETPTIDRQDFVYHVEQYHRTGFFHGFWERFAEFGNLEDARCYMDMLEVYREVVQGCD